jgi:hypothetical protein
MIFRHDDIAKLVGKHGKSFKQTYGETYKEIRRTVLEYVKTFLPTIAGSRAGAGAGDGSDAGDLNIVSDQDGYPIVPSETSIEKSSKSELEKLFRSYLTIHYGMFTVLYHCNI